MGALALFALNYLLVSFLLPPPTTQRVAIPYTLFKQQVDAGNVAAITATADQIQGRLKQAVSYTPPSTGQAVQVTAFSTVQPTFSDPGLLGAPGAAGRGGKCHVARSDDAVVAEPAP